MLFHPEHLPLAVHRVNTLSVKGIEQLSLLSIYDDESCARKPQSIVPICQDADTVRRRSIAADQLDHRDCRLVRPEHIGQSVSCVPHTFPALPPFDTPVLAELLAPECIRDLVQAGAHSVPCDTCTQTE